MHPNKNYLTKSFQRSRLQRYPQALWAEISEHRLFTMLLIEWWSNANAHNNTPRSRVGALWMIKLMILHFLSKNEWIICEIYLWAKITSMFGVLYLKQHYLIRYKTYGQKSL